MLGGELVLHGADQADDQEDRADQHVEAMEAGGHEEGGTVNVRTLAAKQEPGLGVFDRLHAGEQHAQRDGDREAPDEAALVAMQQRMVRPGDRGPRGQQDQRIEQRQVPGVEQLDTGGRPGRTKGGDAGILLVRFLVEEAVEIGPEPGDEEHHFGGDEQDHTVAVMHHHHRGMVTGLAFLDDVAPPRIHGVEHADETGDQDPGRGDVMEPEHRADSHDEGRDRADKGPRAGVYQVIVVVGLGVRSHGQVPSLLTA